jgi:hypothetical protein
VPAQQRLVAVQKEGGASQAAELGDRQERPPFGEIRRQVELEVRALLDCILPEV